MSKLVIGIDPGKDGAIAVMVHDKLISYYKSPVDGNDIDIKAYHKILEDIKKFSDDNGFIIHAFVEDVHAIFGASAKSTFNFGASVAMVHTTLTSLNIPFTLVQPKVWQKAIRVIGDLVRVEQDGRIKTDNKKTALKTAQRLFPDEKFLATKRSRVPHDGIVDACLIAYYGMKFHFK